MIAGLSRAPGSGMRSGEREPILYDGAIRGDSVYKCERSRSILEALVFRLLAEPAGPRRDRCARSKARCVRAFVLMPCKHHANYHGIQSLFLSVSISARARARSRLFPDLMYVYARTHGMLPTISTPFLS